MEDDEDFQPDYALEVGDIVLIQNSGFGFVGKDKNKYVEVIGHGDYFGGEGARVCPYDCQLETESYGDNGVVGYGSFGKSPLILFNINEEHIVDEDHVAVAEGSKERVDKALGIRRDAGQHYRYSFRLNITQDDIDEGFVMVNIDPYRISEVYNLGGWREHLFKKVIRGLDKGHTIDELIDELQCTLDRAKQMREESRE